MVNVINPAGASPWGEIAKTQQTYIGICVCYSSITCVAVMCDFIIKIWIPPSFQCVLASREKDYHAEKAWSQTFSLPTTGRKGRSRSTPTNLPRKNHATRRVILVAFSTKRSTPGECTVWRGIRPWGAWYMLYSLGRWITGCSQWKIQVGDLCPGPHSSCIIK